ncbi:MAG: hypothetical protein WDM89_19425 [Rhizomicrobium sp.]
MGKLVMHTYSSNSADRMHMPFALAAIAIGGAYLVSVFMARLGVNLPWWAPPLDTMTLYGMIYWLFDHQLWKLRILHSAGPV